MTAHDQNWQIQVKEEDQNFTNTCIEQTEDPIKALMVIKNSEIITICNVEMNLCKPKCQTVQHASVQGPFGCPACGVHSNSRGVKRFWVIVTIYMEILNTTAGLSKLHKCSLFIWKALIMFMEGWRGLKWAGA